MEYENQNDTTQERVGFCQNCGKPLNRETIRVVGTAVYCEPCLEAKLAGAPPYGTGAGAAPGYGTVNPAQPIGFQGPLIPGTPNPALAALLGLIPGVGAMYNEQYAKGIAHLVIFVVLVTLSHAAGIFGLLVAGWVAYMAIEAHHTARARRDGLPLPNPFGLNDIGDRMGFGKGWPQPGSGQTVPPYTPPVAGSAAVPTDIPDGASWGAPTDRYSYSPVVNPIYPPLPPLPQLPPLPMYGAGNPDQPGQPGNPEVYAQAAGYGAAYGASYGAGYGAQYDPGVPPYVTTPGRDVPPVQRNRFPVGAIWLIALGTIFLIGNTGLFRGIPETALVGIGLVGLSLWIFIRKLATSGTTLQDDGSPMYTVRLLRALRGAVWVMLVGVLLLLSALHWISWSRSWPYFIILAGVMTILERTAYNSAAAHAYQYPAAGPASGYAAPPTPTPGSGAAPTSSEEGR